jgi:predicted transcriptional regulator of viral defense system
MKGIRLIRELARRGQFWFTTAELVEKLGVSKAAANGILNRLERDGYVARPVRGFSVIVPPEYYRLKCLPPEELTLGLMDYWNLPYYVGLLSGAEYYGAAPQRPQVFQVVLPINRRPVVCGNVRVSFIARRNAGDVPTNQIKTRRGYIRVSTPEVTAIDLVGYQRRVGGADAVAQILSALLPQLTSEGLLKAAMCSPVNWAQRLGYLLDRISTGDLTEALRRYVISRTTVYTPLSRYLPDAAPRDERWRVLINASLSSEV